MTASWLAFRNGDLLLDPTFPSMSAGAVDDNVWTSGQAVAAFDAFGDELPVSDTDMDLDAVGRVVDTSFPDDVAGTVVDDGAVDIPTDLPGTVPADADVSWDAGQPARLTDMNDLGDLAELADLPDDPSGLDAFGS